MSGELPDHPFERAADPLLDPTEAPIFQNHPRIMTGWVAPGASSEAAKRVPNAGGQSSHIEERGCWLHKSRDSSAQRGRLRLPTLFPTTTTS